MGAVSSQGIPTSVGPQRKGVTHVPGLMCYLCTRFVPVFLGRTFGDVPVGEWVAVVPLQGTLKIARNFANAAEASGCRAGDALFISKRPSVK